MNPLGSYLIANELLDRDARRAERERAAVARRPDALPISDGSETAARGGWLARILAGHQPPVARRKGAHI